MDELENELDYVKYKDLLLPKKRSNQGLKNDEDYLNSGNEQINYLNENNLLDKNSNILDFGCGQGRILNCFKHVNVNFQSYTGVDTDGAAINWCSKYLTYSDNIKFIHIPAFNQRYNKEGVGLIELPFEKNTFDLIFLNSVFSHMLSSDIMFYLKEFHKILNNDGKIYLTAFIEENVPNEEENPTNYLGKNLGPLHRVRFEKNYFSHLIQSSSFKIEKYDNQFIKRTGQSVILLSKL